MDNSFFYLFIQGECGIHMEATLPGADTSWFMSGGSGLRKPSNYSDICTIFYVLYVKSMKKSPLNFFAIVMWG